MPYQCNQCNMGFSRESFLKQHQEKHLSKQDWIWNCRICPQNFPSETRYVYIKFAKIVNYSIFHFSEIRGLWFMKCLSIFWIRKLTFHIKKLQNSIYLYLNSEPNLYSITIITCAIAIFDIIPLITVPIMSTIRQCITAAKSIGKIKTRKNECNSYTGSFLNPTIKTISIFISIKARIIFVVLFALPLIFIFHQL